MPNAADARRLDLDHTGAALIMRPEVPDLLQDVLAAAERTIKRPSGDPRRIDELERLFEKVDGAQHWATDEPRRLVNRRTVELVRELRALERLGPFGEADEIALGKAIAVLLQAQVQRDALAAMMVRARAGREAIR